MKTTEPEMILQVPEISQGEYQESLPGKPVAVYFHQLETPKTSHTTVASKAGTNSYVFQVVLSRENRSLRFQTSWLQSAPLLCVGKRKQLIL